MYDRSKVISVQVGIKFINDRHIVIVTLKKTSQHRKKKITAMISWEKSSFNRKGFQNNLEAFCFHRSEFIFKKMQAYKHTFGIK